ncbi:MAG: 1-acyl-sn-glycerol-3-phosphate acyltransferase [Sulfuricella sp.]|nr:1-acyl-sn-glycerol-3-phosphate acyltransferase [Sulfuricella sp.]
MGQHSASCYAWRIIGRLAFNRITVLGRERLPSSGAVLYVATHRNGALDAAPYALAVPDAIPMVSAQLQRSALGRFLFRGIAVARAKDRARGMAADNRDAVQRCIAVLQGGGRVLVMPEGSSALGFRHLPFQRGAARIAQAAVEAGVKLTIVALGVHYEDPTAWQSRVEVLVGEPRQILPDADVAAIHRLVVAGLEAVGANFADEEARRSAETLAYAATLGTSVHYAPALKHFEQIAPDALGGITAPLATLARRERLCLHQGVPLVPVGPWPLYALYWLILAPLVVGFCALNAPVLIAGFIASRKLPDAPNVVAFWRMAMGLPTGGAWAGLASTACAAGYGLAGVAVYWGISLAGIGAWYRFRKLSVALCNGLFRSAARPALLQAYLKLLEEVPHD